ncbi:RNA-binding protein [Bacillus sp. DJP31]|uniref:YlmH family RNA-binding protein n=1 Tax=Bacillus sp. DJP31 TaxID=3409789 RepID=UPI003BB5916E
MSIYQHFRPEEHAFIDQVLKWKESVRSTFVPRLTDFLDPREQKIIKSIIGEDTEITISFFGGATQVERKRALLFPDYYVPLETDYQVQFFEVQYPHKFVTIEHPQVLGSLMSLGLKRSKFGDILKKEETIQLMVAKEISDFILLNLQSIGRAKITLVEKEANEMIKVIDEWREEAFTVSSMRLDVVVAEAYNLSRSKAAPLIKGGVVKVNWRQVEEVSFECKEGDVISVRGHGRCKIIEIEGQTKREKWRIKVGKVK